MINFRFAVDSDSDLYYHWVNDPEVRKNSFIQSCVTYVDHCRWFNGMIRNSSAYLYVFYINFEEPIGQVRIMKNTIESTIGISLDAQYRGKGYASKMIEMACSDFLSKFPDQKMVAFIKSENKASLRSFTIAGFYNVKNQSINGINSFRLIYTK
jgi:UDP-2,4-diacetamido-2,4,6-trideoxy-beta-L-altropyranose hydrolase